MGIFIKYVKYIRHLIWISDILENIICDIKNQFEISKNHLIPNIKNRFLIENFGRFILMCFWQQFVSLYSTHNNSYVF